VVDDDRNLRDIVRSVLEEDGRMVQDYGSAEAFLSAYRPGTLGCLLIDAYLPGIGGLELLLQLQEFGDVLPAIMVTGRSDVSMAVQAMKAGAVDFIEKPISAMDLLGSINLALERASDAATRVAWQDSAAAHIADLTPRQRQIMDLVLAGHPSKNIAADLGISQRTVESHRASIMRTTESKSLPALARLALAAGLSTKQGPRRRAAGEMHLPSELHK
jgi:two-component system CheB/CheR fusion protein